ncbi:hypothetical protein LSH36_59g08036 [Paralvinella palmiformis]|uniref:Uncharacterized protein n=1 Tax=Paralvinella palmiformis TaxID=53620 RepID=A0AAD9NDP7_9ANNE|nr:hypothetical protein LSH36_59g08036 [Paralvinella palmiformis]
MVDVTVVNIDECCQCLSPDIGHLSPTKIVQLYKLKDWLKPASASLQKLDQVCTNIYNLGLSDSRQLKPTNVHGVKAEQKAHNADGCKPPLPDPSIKKVSRAWGSSSSVPDLIKKQIQRQRSRPESAKVSRQMRPPSGRKPRPQSAKEFNSNKTENGLTSDKTVPAGIKGEHCEPSERPDGTSVYLGGTTRMASVSSYEITQNGSRTKQMKDCEDDFEYLYGNDKLLNKELGDVQYASNMSLDESAPPPPPRGSPNFLHMLESEEADPEDQDSISKMIDGLLDNQHSNHNTQTLLRKPKPEPISFSLPTMDLEDDEVKVSFDENGVVINKKKDKSITIHKMGNKDIKSEMSHQSNYCCHSPETLIGQENEELTGVVMEPEGENLFTHPKCIKVNLIVEDPGEMCTNDLQLNLGPFDGDNLAKNHPIVKFDEDKNVLIEITPRDGKKRRPQSAKLATYKGRPELRHVKGRTDSGVTSSLSRTAKKSDIKACVENDVMETLKNHQNGEMPKSKLSFVTVNYLDDSDSEEEPWKKKKSKKFSRTAQNIETCMSHFGYSSDENSDTDCLKRGSDLEGGGSDSNNLIERPGSAKKTMSRREANYYELVRNSPHPGSDSENDQKGKKIKTVKTIELTSDGSVKETVFVSRLDVIETKGQKTYVAPRPLSAKKNRPINSKKPDVSPGKHPDMDCLQEQTENDITDAPEQIVTNPVRRQRVRSAPVNRKPDLLAERIREIHRNISEKNKSCSCKGQAHIHSKSNTDMSKLASRDKSARRYYTGYPMNDVKAKLPNVEVPERVVEIWTRKDEFEIETDGVKECKEMHARLIEAGVPVTLETLKRGLLPPTEYGFAGPTYKSVCYPHETPNYTDSLLSDPATSWLSDEHKRVMQLKKKVREATKALEQQQLEDAREALEAEARAMKKAKRKSGKKSKKKRPKSAK